MEKLPGVRSNWEFVVWYLIDPCISEKDRSFTRAEIMRKNYDDIYGLLILLGHKKRPQHAEETIQRTLQNMRDKNWISFLGQGDYKLTNEGYSELLNQRQNINKVLKNFGPEACQILRGVARKA